MSDDPRAPEPPEPTPAPFRFKPRDFVTDNAPASTPSPQGPTDVRELVRLATLNAPTSPAPPAENEVHQILRDNVAHASAAGLNDLKPLPKRRSRRLRDYVIVAVAVNLPLGLVGYLFRSNAITLVFVLAAAIMFNLQFAWRVWAIMDDY